VLDNLPSISPFTLTLSRTFPPSAMMKHTLREPVFDGSGGCGDCRRAHLVQHMEDPVQLEIVGGLTSWGSGGGLQTTTSSFLLCTSPAASLNVQFTSILTWHREWNDNIAYSGSDPLIRASSPPLMDALITLCNDISL
jgi:hypothetical protein